MKFTAAIVLGLCLAAAARAGPELSNGARQRAANFTRAGWVVVDGHFAQIQATVAPDDLFRLQTANDTFSVLARPNAAVEPLLRNYRVGLIGLEGSDLAWKISCPGRIWNDAHTAGTQHLLLTAATDPAPADAGTPVLTRVEITPAQQVVQAALIDDGVQQTVILVFGRDFFEATVGRDGVKPKVLIRSATPRRLLADRPTEMRRYVIPVLQLLDRGQNPLRPGATDVYRAFPGLPIDTVAMQAVTAAEPDLTDADPAVRERASDRLRALGPRGVQALMAVDVARLPPEAADRVSALINEASHDPRAADRLRADPNFLLDCLQDEDANVRAAAGKYVGH